MTSISDDLRALLALQDGDTATPTLELQLPPLPVGFGLHDSAAASELATDNLYRFLASEQEPFRVAVNQNDPRLLLLDLELADWDVETVRGRVDLQPDGVVLFAGRERPAVRLRAKDGSEYVVEADSSSQKLRVFSIIRRSGTSQATKWTPSAFDPPFEIPSSAAVLGSLQAPEWLREIAESLAGSDSIVDRAASLGVIARLWEPATREEGDAIQRQELPDPNAAVVAWARSLDTRAVESLARAAIAETEVLSGSLDQLHQAAGETPELAADLARYVVKRRDDLESVAFVLSACQRSRPLRTALLMFDNSVPAYLSAFPPRDVLFAGERWRAVFRNDPMAWWGHSIRKRS